MVMKVNRILGLGAGIGGVSWLLGLAYKWYQSTTGAAGVATATFSTFPLDLPLGVNVKQQILSGVDTSLASQLLQTVGGGNIPAMTGLVMALIAGIVVAFVGVYAVNFLKGMKVPFTGKNPIGKITAIMVWGTLISGGIVALWSGGTLAIPAFGLIIALIIYYLIAGWVYLLIRNLGIKQLPEPE